MNSFTIKDIENLSGIKAHTLRIWEQRYHFLKPERTFTNIRYYSNEELKRILNIALLNKYGFKISHIDKMGDAEIKEKILSLNQIEAQSERIINELIRSMVDLDMLTFENALNKFINARGVEHAITQIIFPFLEKIGILWMTNHINPAQEHLVSNIIRQKLIVGIDKICPPVKIKKKVLLFLPEGEYHEMGLLYMHFLLKKKGTDTIYLGASIPLEDVAYVVNLTKPDYIFCHLTTVSQSFNFDSFLSSLQQKLSNIPIVISGRLTHSYEKKIQPPLYFKKSLAELMDFVSGL